MRSLFAEINQAVKKLRAEGSNFNSPLPNVVTAYLSKETAKKADDAIDNQQVREQQNILSSVSSQLIHHQQLTKPQSFEFTDRYTQLNHLTDTFDDSEDYLQNSGLVLL